MKGKGQKDGKETEMKTGARRGKQTHLEMDFFDLNEAGLLKGLSLDTVLKHRHGAAHLLPALLEELSKLAHGGLLVYGAVVASEGRRGLVRLDETAGFEAFVGLPEEGRPVLDASEDPADVHVIERVLAKGPILRAVVDLAALGAFVNNVEFGHRHRPGVEWRMETHNWRLGGTQLGWIGERSVPITSVLGNSSAKSLLSQ